MPSHRSEHKCLPSAGHCARDLTLDSEGLVLSSLSMPTHWMSCLSPRERKPLLPTPTPAARPGLVPAQSKYPQTRDSRIVLWVCGQLLEVLAGHRWFLERESMAGLSVLLSPSSQNPSTRAAKKGRSRRPHWPRADAQWSSVSLCLALTAPGADGGSH